MGKLYTEESPGQTAVEAFKVGGSEAFQPRWYYSSTQRSANTAFTMHFAGGLQDSFDKSSELHVRPVRSELLID